MELIHSFTSPVEQYCAHQMDSWFNSTHCFNATQQFHTVTLQKHHTGYDYPFYTMLPFSVSQRAKPMFSLSVTHNSSINTFFSNAANSAITHLPVNCITM